MCMQIQNSETSTMTEITFCLREYLIYFEFRPPLAFFIRKQQASTELLGSQSSLRMANTFNLTISWAFYICASDEVLGVACHDLFSSPQKYLKIVESRHLCLPQTITSIIHSQRYSIYAQFVMTFHRSSGKEVFLATRYSRYICTA